MFFFNLSLKLSLFKIYLMKHVNVLLNYIFETQKVLKIIIIIVFVYILEKSVSDDFCKCLGNETLGFDLCRKSWRILCKRTD